MFEADHVLHLPGSQGTASALKSGQPRSIILSVRGVGRLAGSEIPEEGMT